ncbi:hypothetical protein L227DRAFT_64944 [Lentinus tigrinus ALCF2SS1-6]|uniref:Uncharacterized protein n=1 Tax=Lentinus tigrinus ALCF2SS1-6 TaxID=1328759 RepID=A0A5C2SC97_9APHY|nr:hypothetical protein L227DRAFT_64944 [Lentinus tigrinus ALCF2SS1-6]
MPPCATYQQHLRTLEQGLPVWDPSPKNSLEIIPGSVLYPGISGTFSVLFNARKSADDTHWQPHGVPRGFRTLDEEFGPLVVDGPRTVVGLRGWNCIGVECTREVSGGLDIGVPAGAAPIIAAGGVWCTARTQTRPHHHIHRVIRTCRFVHDAPPCELARAGELAGPARVRARTQTGGPVLRHWHDEGTSMVHRRVRVHDGEGKRGTFRVHRDGRVQSER